MKTILVPVDFSAVTNRVIAEAGALARLIGGRLVLLHVVPPLPTLMNDYYAFDPGPLTQATAAAEKSGARKLRAIARRLAPQIPVQTTQDSGAVVERIVAAARSGKASYLVMGSHGHGAMFDLIVGSTTHGVLRKVHCPVLVVPARP
jgi:nucleotide-binding universal stress UspA family protein